MMEILKELLINLIVEIIIKFIGKKMNKNREKFVPVTTKAPVPVVTDSPPIPQVTIHDPSNSTSRSYVLNTNTKKFHCPDCSSVNQMSAKNRNIEPTREALIAQGYSPCGKCNP